MRADQWSGLVTKASPYILPAGAAVEQVNLSPVIPGQLTTRGGMRKVACTEEAGDILDCFPYEQDGRTILVALTASGSLVALPSPAYSTPTPLPAEPLLSLSSGQTGTTYTQRFVVGQTTETAPPPPAESEYTNVLDSGDADSAPTYEVVSGEEYSSLYETTYDGGFASTASYPPTLKLSAIPSS